MIEEAQVVVHEADQPDLVGDLFDADVLTGEHLAEVDLVPAEADTAAAGDGDGAIVEGVVDRVEAAIRAG